MYPMKSPLASVQSSPILIPIAGPRPWADVPIRRMIWVLFRPWSTPNVKTLLSSLSGAKLPVSDRRSFAKGGKGPTAIELSKDGGALKGRRDRKSELWGQFFPCAVKGPLQSAAAASSSFWSQLPFLGSSDSKTCRNGGRNRPCCLSDRRGRGAFPPPPRPAQIGFASQA